MSLSLWSDPYSELRGLQRDLDRMFESTVGLPFQQTGLRRWMPSFDIKESGNNLLIRADLPGVKREDIKLELNNGFLTVSGERKQEKKEESEKFYRSERIYGSFCRSFPVSSSVTEDQIKAHYENGVLDILLPKEEVPQRKNIPIN